MIIKNKYFEWSVLAKIISVVTNILILILSAKYFGTEGRGKISLFVADMAIIMLIANIAAGPIIINLVKKYSTSSIIKLLFIGSILLAFPSLILIYFLHPTQEYFLYLAFNAIVFCISIGLLELNLSLGKIYLYNRIQILFSILLLCSFVLLIYFDFDARAYAISFTIASSVQFVFLLFNLPKNNLEANVLSDSKKIILSGMIAQASNIFDFLTSRSIFYILVSMWGLSVLGLTSTSISIGELFWFFPLALSPIIRPFLAHSQNENEKIIFTNLIMKFSFWTSSIGLITLILLPSSVFEIVLGKQFEGTQALLLFLLPGIVSSCMAKVLWDYNNCLDKNKINSIAGLISATSTIIFGLILIPDFSFRGAAIAYSIGQFIHLVYMLFLYDLKKHSLFELFLLKKEDIKNFMLYVRNSRHLES